MFQNLPHAVFITQILLYKLVFEFPKLISENYKTCKKIIGSIKYLFLNVVNSQG